MQRDRTLICHDHEHYEPWDSLENYSADYLKLLRAVGQKNHEAKVQVY
jgi:hypothetical protein